MGINLNLLKTVTKGSSKVIKQFVENLEKGKVNVGDIWSTKVGGKRVALRVKNGINNSILLDKSVSSKFLAQQTRFQFNSETGKLMNTWRMEQSSKGFIGQYGSTYHNVDYGVYEGYNGRKVRIMFDGNLKNPKNAVNMLTGEKVNPNVIKSGLSSIRGENCSLNIHLKDDFI